MRPIELKTGVVASNPADLADIVRRSSDEQTTAKRIEDAAGREEFLISSDALNFERVAWRCTAEWGPAQFAEIADSLKSIICASRGYEPDDFDSVLQATRHRVRLPYGWSALEYAWILAQKQPIKLLDPGLAGRKLPTAIAGISFHLQKLQSDAPILLPIDQIRALMEQRKIVISGAVQRLLEAGVIAFVDEKYHTGKAREFRFSGVEGEHFVLEHRDKNEDVPAGDGGS